MILAVYSACGARVPATDLMLTVMVWGVTPTLLRLERLKLSQGRMLKPVGDRMTADMETEVPSCQVNLSSGSGGFGLGSTTSVTAGRLAAASRDIANRTTPGLGTTRGRNCHLNAPYPCRSHKSTASPWSRAGCSDLRC